MINNGSWFPTAVKPLILVILILLSACSTKQDKMVGTWKTSNESTTKVLTLHSDGTYVSEIKEVKLGGFVIKSGSISGTWEIKDNRFTGVIKTSSIGSKMLGYSWSDEIVTLEANKLVLRIASSGEIEEWSRKQ